MVFEKILIVGFGTMAQAMVKGWLAAGIEASRFAIYHPRLTEAPHGMTLHNRWPQEDFDAVLLAVKPQALSAIASELEPLVGPDTALISVLAGAELASLGNHFPRAAGIVRIMPNLACALGKSPNALVEAGLDAAQREEIGILAKALGSAEWLADETQFDLVTALAGSGPAFVYRFIDALAAAGAQLGLDRAQADRLAVAMVEGASCLAAASTHSPGDLANLVASPGGMTRKGLDVLDHDHALEEILEQCLRATRDRGAEMAKAARDQG